MMTYFLTTFCCTFTNVRAASMLIRWVYTTKYLKQRSQERENYITLLRSHHYSILSTSLPSAPSAEDQAALVTTSGHNDMRSAIASGVREGSARVVDARRSTVRLAAKGLAIAVNWDGVLIFQTCFQHKVSQNYRARAEPAIPVPTMSTS